jgi:hypothetical protein
MITTEKDALKLKEIPELEHIPLFFLKIDLEIESEFYQDLAARLADRRRKG